MILRTTTKDWYIPQHTLATPLATLLSENSVMAIEPCIGQPDTDSGIC